MTERYILCVERKLGRFTVLAAAEYTNIDWMEFACTHTNTHLQCWHLSCLPCLSTFDEVTPQSSPKPSPFPCPCLMRSLLSLCEEVQPTFNLTTDRMVTAPDPVLCSQSNFLGIAPQQCTPLNLTDLMYVYIFCEKSSYLLCNQNNLQVPVIHVLLLFTIT